MRIRVGIALIVIGCLVACSGALFGPPAGENELIATEDIPLFLVGLAMAVAGAWILPKRSTQAAHWDLATEGVMIVRSATRLKTKATVYVYAIDVEFDVPGVTAPPGRYEIRVAHGKETLIAVGSRIRVRVVRDEGQLLVRAHLHPRSPDPRARDYYEELTPVPADGSG